MNRNTKAAMQAGADAMARACALEEAGKREAAIDETVKQRDDARAEALELAEGVIDMAREIAALRWQRFILFLIARDALLYEDKAKEARGDAIL